MVLDHQGEHGSQDAAIRSAAAKACPRAWRSFEAVAFATREWV